MAAKVSKPILFAGILVGAVALIMVTSPSDESGGTSGMTLAELRKGGSQSKKVASAFDEGDVNAKFDRLNEDPKNAFMPLVVRLDAGMSGGGLAPNEFPANFTGGEPGWFYTGTVIENNVPSALVENMTTGEGYYLKVGDALKKSVIAKITPTYILVNGVAGKSLRLDLLADPPEIEGGFSNLAVEPVRPDVEGIIGRQNGRPGGSSDRGIPGLEEEQQ